MVSRIVAALAALILLGLIAALSAPVLIGVRSPVLSPLDSARPVATLEQPTSAGFLKAELFLLPELGYRLDLLVTLDPEASSPLTPSPTVMLEMEGMVMDRVEVPLELVAMAEFRARGSFPMPGRWLFRIGLEDELFSLPVSVSQTSVSSPPPTPAAGSTGSTFGHLLDHLAGGWL